LFSLDDGASYVIKSFFWMAEQAWDGVMYYWVVSAPLFLLACAAFILRWRRLADSGWRTRVWLAAPFLMPIVVLLWGASMGHVDGSVAAPVWTSYVLSLLLLASLGFFALCIWRTPGLRWVAAALAVLVAWFTFLSAFIAGMALTNDWL
jgi:hypothetical protein